MSEGKGGGSRGLHIFIHKCNLYISLQEYFLSTPQSAEGHEPLGRQMTKVPAQRRNSSLSAKNRIPHCIIFVIVFHWFFIVFIVILYLLLYCIAYSIIFIIVLYFFLYIQYCIIFLNIFLEH